MYPTKKKYSFTLNLFYALNHILLMVKQVPHLNNMFSMWHTFLPNGTKFWSPQHNIVKMRIDRIFKYLLCISVEKLSIQSI